MLNKKINHQDFIDKIQIFDTLTNQLQKLLSEAEMCELFKACAFSKNLKPLLPGMSLQDLPGLRGRNRL